MRRLTSSERSISERADKKGRKGRLGRQQEETRVKLANEIVAVKQKAQIIYMLHEIPVLNESRTDKQDPRL